MRRWTSTTSSILYTWLLMYISIIIYIWGESAVSELKVRCQVWDFVARWCKVRWKKWLMRAFQPEASITELLGSFNLQILPDKACRSETHAYEIYPSHLSVLKSNKCEHTYLYTHIWTQKVISRYRWTEIWMKSHITSIQNVWLSHYLD